MNMIILAATGWTTAIIAVVLFISARQINRDWRKLHLEKNEKIRDLEHKHIVREMDVDRMKRLSDENTLLRIKCDAICRQIRKIKNRGNVVCEIHPQHNF